MSSKKHKDIDEDYILNGAAEISDEDMKYTLNKKRAIEDKISKSGLLKKYLTISKLMLQMLNDYRKGNYRDVPWLTISSMVFTLLYVLNPMDLIPDFITIIGYLDDITVLAIGLNLVETDIKKYLDWKVSKDSDFSSGKQ